MSCRQHGYPWPSLATSPWQVFRAKSPLYLYIEFTISEHILYITFLKLKYYYRRMRVLFAHILMVSSVAIRHNSLYSTLFIRFLTVKWYCYGILIIQFNCHYLHTVKCLKFGLVSLFNGISTFFRLFNAKAILLEEQELHYLTNGWDDKIVHTFPKSICLKVNVIARLEYELAYYDFVVHRFNHYTTRTPTPLNG